MIQRIPAVGADLLAHIPRIDEVCRIIRYQNRRFDGLDSPGDELAGEDIPLGARMLKALADLGHLERKGLSCAAALEQMRGCPGLYDPRILHAISEASWFAPEPPETGREGPRGDIRQSSGRANAGGRPGNPGRRDDRVRREPHHPAVAGTAAKFATLTGIKEPIHVED